MIVPKFVKAITHRLDDLGQKFNQANEAHAANYTAITHLLIEKGVITKEEYDATRMFMTQAAEQEWARKRDELENKDTSQ